LAEKHRKIFFLLAKLALNLAQNYTNYWTHPLQKEATVGEKRKVKIQKK
jgi:hypothetical protein